MESSFEKLPRKWLVVILLVALAAETAIIIALFTLVGGWFVRNQAFPSVSFSPYLNPSMLLQCYAMTPTVVARNRDNRTVLFDCGDTSIRKPALKVPGVFFEPSEAWPAYWLATPSFNLPTGYLRLSLTYTGDCTDRFSIVLASGHAISVSEDHEYSYCGVISGSTAKADSFHVRWLNLR